MGDAIPQNSNKRGKAGRFVLLVDAHMRGPMKLLEGLRKRDAAVRVVSDPAQAMVEIAQFKAQVLIVHEPETVTGLESLLSAVRLYHPSVICWRHEAATPGRRENLAPFACQLKAVSAPRFTPAPKSLTTPVGNPDVIMVSQDGRHSAEVVRQPVGQNKKNSIQSDQSNKTSSTSPTTNGHAKTAATQEVDQTNSNGSRPWPNPFEVKIDADEIESKRNKSSSLGQRLAIPLDALDDLTAGPLLSAEEIELLRGPIDEDDDSQGHFFSK